MNDRRTGQPMSVGFWIGNGPRKVIIPVTFAVILTFGTLMWKSFQLYGQQKALSATMDERSAQRDKQIESLQSDVKALKEDVANLRTNAITRNDVNDIKQQISELRVVLLRGRE